MKQLFIERLAKHHVKDGFDCGKEPLNSYIRRYASQNEKRGLGRTYVAVYDAERTVVGYYTLVASKVSFEHWPEGMKLPPNMHIPTILLERLAIDHRYQGQKLGKRLLLHAMWRTEQIAADLGAVALEVDALDGDARAFYEQYGFELLKDDPLHLFLALDSIRRLHLDYTSMTR